MSVIKIEKINNKDFPGIKEDWDRLAAMCNPGLFWALDWAYNWWRFYSKDKKLMVLIARDDTGIIAIAPLVITKESFNRIPARKLELMYRANFIIPFRKEDVLRGFLNYANSVRETWDIIDFSDMCYEKDLIAILEKEGRKLGFDFMLKDGDVYPFVCIDRPWEEYWLSRKSKFRKNLKNAHKAINSMGGVSVNVGIYDQLRISELENALEKIFTLSLKSWQAGISAAIGSNQENIEFYRNIVKTFVKQGKIEISFLEHNGVPVAGTIGMIYKDTFYGFKNYYDEKYANISPGNVLMEALLKQLFNSGVKKVDFLRGLFPQKLKWLTGMEKKAHVMIFKNSLHSGILKFSEARVRKWMNLKDKMMSYVKNS